MQRPPFRLLVSPGIMTGKAYSVFLCVLLISVLFFPLTTAGRVLLGTHQKEGGSGNHGNGRSKMPVNGSTSPPDKSASGQSSPYHATPTMGVRPNKSNPRQFAAGTAYPGNLPAEKCGTYVRDC